jgi:hypothetical protein
MGSSVVLKARASFFTSLFLHNPTKIRVRMWLTNSKISWIDIQFASSNLTAAMRGSLSGCKIDEDTLVHSVEPREQKAAKEENISEYKKASKATSEEKERYSTYL